jgi:hypothetical protein
VVITVVAMGVMQMTVDEVVDVVSMGDRLMSTAGTMHMRCIVAAALMFRGAVGGVGAVDGEDMLVNVAFMRVVQVSIVQVVDVTIVLDGCVATIWAVGVTVVSVNVAVVVMGHVSYLGQCITRMRAGRVG